MSDIDGGLIVGGFFESSRFFIHYLCSTMNYLEITFEISPKAPWSDILTAYLAEIGFESFVETESGFQAYIQADLFDEN